MESAGEKKREVWPCGPEAGTPAGLRPEPAGYAAGRSEIIGRVEKLLNERGATRHRLARRADVSRHVIDGWFGGRCSPDGSSLARIAKALETTPWRLLTGRSVGPPGWSPAGAWIDGARVPVPEFEAVPQGAAGGCAFREVPGGEEAAYLLKRLARFGIDPEGCRRVRAADSGMAPLVRAGDLVLAAGCAPGEKFRSGGTCLVGWGEGPRVRKQRMAGDGGLAARCLNPEYGDVSFTAGEAAAGV